MPTFNRTRDFAVSMASPMIPIRVKEKVYYIHQDLLIQASDNDESLFECYRADNSNIWLEHTLPEIFDLFVIWLYSRRFNADPRTIVDHVLYGLEGQPGRTYADVSVELMRLDSFADVYGIGALRNDVVAGMMYWYPVYEKLRKPDL